MKRNILRKLLVGVLALGTLSIAACGKSKMIDYTHNGSVQLLLDYVGHDFFVDGVGEVTLKSHIDGDTAHFYPKVGHTSTVLKARFYGIDTPESTGAIQPYGKAASNFTKEKLKNASEHGTIVISSPASTYAEPQPDSTGSRYLSLVWINETKQNAPKEELYLLNLWIVQEGLSWAKNVSAVPEYADIFQNAQNQAEKNKLNLWSGLEDPDYNYGAYNETSLLDIKYEIAEFIEDQDHVNAFNGANVIFNGTVSGYADNSLYVQEFYPSDPAHPENGGEYAGINIFTGMTAIPSKYTTVGTYIKVAGTAVDSENFGFQITNTQGHWPVADTTAENDCKVLISAEDNTGEHKLKTFEYTRTEVNTMAAKNDLTSLYCRTHVTDDLVCRKVYINDSGEVTLYFENADFTVYMPFQYAGNPDQPSSVWYTEDDFLGKTFNVTGVYTYHNTASKKITYQIIPSGAADLVCKTPIHGTAQYDSFHAGEVNQLINSGDYSSVITYYVEGVISSVGGETTTGVNLVIKDSAGSTLNLNGVSTEKLNASAKKRLVVGSTVFAKGHIGSTGFNDGVLLAAYTHGGVESDPLTVAEALSMASSTASDIVYVVGQITSIEKPYDASETNPRLSVSLGDLKFVNGKLGTGVNGENIVVGATVMLRGKLIVKDGVTTFDGLPQIVSATVA